MGRARSSFTPGPWVLEQRKEWDAYEVSRDQTRVAIVSNSGDARLIATAPELLQALQDLLAPVDPRDGYARRVIRAQTAIAKATGTARGCDICRRHHGPEVEHERE